MMPGLRRLLMVFGVVMLVVGFVLQYQLALPGLGWLGKLPGDIRIEREGFRLLVPLGSCLLISLVLTLLLQLWSRLR